MSIDYGVPPRMHSGFALAIASLFAHGFLGVGLFFSPWIWGDPGVEFAPVPANVGFVETPKVGLGFPQSHRYLGQLTPWDAESLDLYTGAIHVDAVDFSAPVAPGLNMEVVRSYHSEPYFNDLTNHKHHDFSRVVPSWHLNAGYILEYNGDMKCNRAYENVCQPKYISAQGQTQELLPEENAGVGHYRTKAHWKGVKEADGRYTLTAPNGFVYTFRHWVGAYYSHRYYLTRVETPDGAWVAYSYVGIWVSKITSSNPNQVIDIGFDVYKTRYPEDDGHRHSLEAPNRVYYNGQMVATYGHKFHRLCREALRNQLMLDYVVYPNGQRWRYDYEGVDVRMFATPVFPVYVGRVVLRSVLAPDGTEIRYGYGPAVSGQGEQTQVKSITHLRGGAVLGHWAISKQAIGVDGVAALKVRVVSPDKTTETVFSDRQHDWIWRMGLPMSHSVYASIEDADLGASRALETQHYGWAPVYQSGRSYHTDWNEKTDRRDVTTQRARWISQTIQRGSDVYRTDYSDFDADDHPQTIVETGDQGLTQTHKLQYTSNPERHILGQLLSVETEGQSIQTQTFDEKGHIVAQTHLKVPQQFEYDGQGQLMAEVDALGRRTEYRNHRFGIPQETLYPDGHTEGAEVNDQGQVIARRDAKGAISRWDYNLQGQLLREEKPLTTPTTYSYQAYNTTVMQGGLKHWHESSLYQDPIFDQKDTVGMRTHHDGVGRKVFESNPFEVTGARDGEWVGHYFYYDALGRVFSDCYPNPQADCTRYTYLDGHRIQTQTPDGTVKTEQYQAYGSPDEKAVVRIEEPERTTEIERDSLGHVLAVHQNGKTQRWAYNDQFEVVETHTPEAGTTHYTRNLLGLLLEKETALGKTHYRYHPENDRLLEVTYSDGSPSETYQYDIQGREIASQKGDMRWTKAYDEADRVTTATLTDGQWSGTFHYRYTPEGHTESLTYPSGLEVSYQPNVQGQPTQIGLFAQGLTYHPNGLLKSAQYGNTEMFQRTLDAQGRTIAEQWGNRGYRYGYDTMQRLTSMTSMDGYHAPLTLGYDALNRLSHAQGPWGSVEYQYDAQNNIQAESHTPAVTGTKAEPSEPIQTDYEYHGQGHLKSRKQGRQVESFTYSPVGQLIDDGQFHYRFGLDEMLLDVTPQKGKGTERYYYDAAHHRTVQRFADHLLYTVYDAKGHLLLEYNTAEPAQTEFIYLHGHRLASVKTQQDLKQKATPTPTVSYYGTDRVGSPLWMTDAEGKLLWREVYAPFGARVEEDKDKAIKTQSNRQWFAEREADRSGLHYFGARYYHPGLGRFISPDPVDTDPLKPETFNRYIYANNSPYVYEDPEGRFWHLILGAISTLMSAYDGYHAYQSGGWSAAAASLGRDAALFAATGGTGKALVYGYNAWKAARGAQVLGHGLEGTAKGIRSNPFKGKTFEEIDHTLTERGFRKVGPDPASGRGSYFHPETGRKYYLDKGGFYKEGVELPHVDVHRMHKGVNLESTGKRRYPLGETLVIEK